MLVIANRCPLSDAREKIQAEPVIISFTSLGCLEQYVDDRSLGIITLNPVLYGEMSTNLADDLLDDREADP